MRAFLVTGPESAGNRLLAALLVRAGCRGAASTQAPFTDDVPSGVSPVVLIRSLPHGEAWPDLPRLIGDLRARGYDVTVLVTVREPVALARSQVAAGHARSEDAAWIAAQAAYAHIFGATGLAVPCFAVPYEGLVLHPDSVLPLMRALGLDDADGPVTIEGETGPIRDGNAKHYEAAP